MPAKQMFSGCDDSSDAETDTTATTETTNSDSDSDSDSSTASTSSSSSSSAAGALPSFFKKKGATKDSDSDSSGGKKKLLSKRDKLTEALLAQKAAILNHISIRDYSSLLDDVDRMQKVAKTAPSGRQLPEWLSALRSLESFFDENDEKELKKKLNKMQAKNLSILKHRTRKFCTDLREDLDAYQSDDESSEDSESSLDEVDIEDDKPQKKRQRTKKPKKDAGEEEKKKKEEEWTEEAIERKLAEVMMDRGRKNTKTEDLVERLKVILGHTGQWVHLTLYVLSGMLSCQLDRDASLQLALCLPASIWKLCYDWFTRIMNILQDNPHVIAVDQDDDRERRTDAAGGARKACEPFEGDKVKVFLTCSIHQVVDFLSDEYTKSLQFSDPHTQEYVARLTDECYVVDACERVHSYYKAQGRRTQAAHMALRLMDVLYYRRKEDHAKMTTKQRALTFERPHQRKKGGDAPDSDVAGLDKELQEATDIPKEKAVELARKCADKLTSDLDKRTLYKKQWIVQADLEEVIKYLHGFVYKNLQGTGSDPQLRGSNLTNSEASIEERYKTKALLYFVYHLALHDHYNQARDLLLMSRRHAESEDHQKYVNSTPLMILYNRVIAQLGLASFRAGEFEHTNTILNDLAFNRARECLAQSLAKNRDKADNDRSEKTKLVPFHMHINVDMIDGCHLTAAVLREVPKRAQYPHDAKRRPQSRSFSRLLSLFSQQVFIGPPETTKELVFAAYQALQRGDWQKTNEHVMNLQMWSSMKDSQRVKDLVTDKIKTEGLRTYLYTYSQYYTTVQLGELAQKYELDEGAAHAVVSKMILKQHITAAWDQPQQCICVEQNSVTKLQFLASQMSDKCSQLVEYNEKRQAEKEERQGGRQDNHNQGYQHGRRRRQYDQSRLAGGIQKSRQVDRKQHNTFERKTWKRG